MTAKQQYKQIGKILLVFTILASVLQILFSILYKAVFKVTVDYNSILGWIVTFAPIYLIAFPISLVMFKKLPVKKAEPQNTKFSRFLVYFIECIAIMYIGNIIGSFLSSALSDGEAINPLTEITSSNSFSQVLVVSIIAPIIEEIVFRKKIIDHTIMYGEKASIIYSAFTFALFHMNLYQFFYAFGLGLMFGYIYVKTRNIKYPIIIHVIINFFGGVVEPFILSQIDMTAIENINLLSESEIISMLIPLLILIVYSIVLIILVIIGVILLIKNRKKISFNQTELDIPREEIVKTSFLNTYYVLFAVFCLGAIILTLLINSTY